jgi:hypothetical protein
MKEQEKSSEGEIDGLDEGSQDLETSAAPTKTKEDPAEPRFIDWPKD